MSDRPLRVLSIAHTAVSRETGRLRYHPFASMPGYEVHLLAPSRWQQFGRTTNADPAGRSRGDDAHRAHNPAQPAGSEMVRPFPCQKARRNNLGGFQPDVIHPVGGSRGPSVALQATLLRGNAALRDRGRSRTSEAAPAALRGHSPLCAAPHGPYPVRGAPMPTAVVRARAPDGPCRPIGYGVDRAVFSPAH